MIRRFKVAAVAVLTLLSVPAFAAPPTSGDYTVHQDQTYFVGNVNLDGNVTVAAGAAGQAVSIASGTGDVTVTSTDDISITATDDVAINGGSTGSVINVGTSAFATLITAGNETGASSLALKAGTGNITMDGVAGTTITIGDAAQTGTVSLGASTANMTLDIGTGTGVHTINIATGGTGADVVAIGGGVGTLAIDTGDWDISTTGAMTGIGAITADGAVSFTSTMSRGSCTLDGASPSKCAPVTITAGAKCVCGGVGTSAAIAAAGCAANETPAGTVTFYSADGLGNDVNYHCF